MNSIKTLFTLMFLVVLHSAYSDIIPENSHFVEKCVKITNLNDYPDVSLIGYIYGIMPSDSYIIDNNCIYKGYKFSSFDIYAVSKDYLKNKDVAAINWAEDKNSVKSNVAIDTYAGYYHDSSPIDKIEEFYKILGFTDNTVVLFKWKEITSYNDGSAALTKTFEYEGDISILKNKLTTSIQKNNTCKSNVVLYPNPASNYISVQISNAFVGSIGMQVISADGKVLSASRFIKNAASISTAILTSSLTNGVYLLKLQFGETVETKQFVIKQ